jgi:UDP-N-acetylmuramoyl-tripeptide--D-alanyl-D-alanine ligase
VFVNVASVPTLAMATGRNFKELITYSAEKDEQYPSVATLLQETPMVTFECDGNTYQSHLTGKYNFFNMCAAIRIGQYFGIDTAVACQAVADYVATNNRSQFIEKGTNQVLMDAYNANPSSMAAAITNFNNLEATKKMVILGDMFELGEEAASEHEALGKLLATCDIDYILLVGKLMESAVSVLPVMKVHYFPDKFGLHNWLQDNPLRDTHILVKGSRGMGLESVLPFLG